MNQPILFSIILPSYNRPVLLEKAVQSVMTQEYTNWELIIIDDGTEEGKKIDLQKISSPQIKYFYQENMGKGAARNLGLDKATGDYICFLDDDDCYKKNHLNTFVQSIAAHPNFSIFKTGIVAYENGKAVFSSPFIKQRDKVLPFLLSNYFGLLDLCIKREIAQAQRFRDYPLWQDKFYLIPLLQAHPINQIEERTVVVNEHEQRSVNRAYGNIDMIKSQLNAIQLAFSQYQLANFSNQDKIINSILSTHFYHAMKYEGIVKAWKYGRQYLKLNSGKGLFLSLVKYQLSYLLH